MNFEKIALQHAEDAGLKEAYFDSGTLFVDTDCVTEEALDYFQTIYPNTMVTRVSGVETAIDFTV